jgi:1-phosphatidylinositol-3-phosphate 5-kinase
MYRPFTDLSHRYAKELNLISMSHLRTMLKQMLTTENIPNVDEWEETLLKLALRIAKEMTFTAFPQRQGQDMDVRRYVKIKKIPGGAPKDSEYVDGAVITKNVAHKHMSRQTRNPRVMLVTFPLEFHRVENQYMPFNQIMLQEKEYLGNLATRIAAVRPHVILAEKSVSGIALEELAKHHIAVARSVKPSAIQLVARVTQADIVSSMDRLLEPRFGHCQRYRIQTFDHPLIPGRRKTFMRFEGCNPSMGCTILLRGGDTDTLTRIKRITRLLAFIVRNLKLETHLWKDSIISVPSLCGGAAPQAYMDTLALNVHTDKGGSRVSMGKNAEGGGYSRRSSVSSNSSSSLSLSRAGTGSVTAWAAESGLIPDEDAEQDRLSRRIQVSLEPYLNTFISASATLRFPPPQPLRKMKELDDMLYSDKRAWEDEIIAREEQQGHRTSGHVQEETMTPGLYSDSVLSTAMPTPNLVLTPKAPDDMMSAEANIKALIESLPSPSVTKTPSPDDTLNGNTDGYFDRPVTSSPSVASTPVEDVPLQFKTVDDVAREGKLSQTRWLHAEQRRVWDWYMRKNKDDFVVEKYQRITLWEGRIPTEEFGQHPLCIPPRMKYITFYGDNDCTLGKYIEKSVHDTLIQFLDPKALCAGVGCGRPMGKHSTVYLHNETRLFVAVEQWDGQVMGQSHTLPPDIITTWSICRLCNSATPFIPVSEEMQRYSFAKFLELHFYPAEVKLVQGAGCHHNIYEHHVRYFACRGMTVRFQADPVVLHEVVYPPRRIRVRPETLLALKNSDYERLLSKYSAWYSELIDELQFISIDATTGEEEADARLNAHINMLITKAEAERTDFMRRMNRVYNESSPYDTLALNQVRAYRQDKLVAWQEEFDRLPRVRASQGTERGGGRRASAFGTMRGMFPRRGDHAAGEWNTASSSVSDAEDSGGPFLRKLMTSSMSSVESVSESESKATSPKLPEMEAETEKIPRSESPPPLESPEGMSTPGTEVPPSEESQSTNKTDSDAEGGADADSDSTIGVGNKGTIKAIAAPAPIAVEGSEGVPGVDAVCFCNHGVEICLLTRTYHRMHPDPACLVCNQRHPGSPGVLHINPASPSSSRDISTTCLLRAWKS